MSSHHVVREKQEPALLVLGMNNFSTEMLGQLLEWSPTVIVTADMADVIDSHGIKIDWIISNRTGKTLQSDVKYLSAGTDTLPEAALKHLISNGYPAVNIIADELQLKDYLFFADKINLVIFYNDQRIYAISSGFSKWKPKGEIIEILTHSNQLHCNGLEPLGNHRFRTINDGFFSLQFDGPFLFIAENPI